MTTIREELHEAIQTGRSDRIAEAVDRWMVGTLTDTELADMAACESTDSQPVQNELSTHGAKT